MWIGHKARDERMHGFITGVLGRGERLSSYGKPAGELEETVVALVLASFHSRYHGFQANRIDSSRREEISPAGERIK